MLNEFTSCRWIILYEPMDSNVSNRAQSLLFLILSIFVTKKTPLRTKTKYNNTYNGSHVIKAFFKWKFQTFAVGVYLNVTYSPSKINCMERRLWNTSPGERNENGWKSTILHAWNGKKVCFKVKKCKLHCVHTIHSVGSKWKSTIIHCDFCDLCAS